MNFVLKCIVVIITIIIFTTYEVNCGLLTGDLKLHTKPFSIKNHHAPIQININTDKLKAPFPPLLLPKPAKPPPKDLSDLLKPSLFSKPSLTKSLQISKLPKLSSLSKPNLFSPFSPLSRLTPLIPPIIPPLVPGLPFLPFLPPIIPPLPLLPLIPPVLPRIPRVPYIDVLKPLRVPILGKSSLQKALGSELSPVAVKISDGRKDLILLKLRDLLKKGSLTTAEFNRFRRLLIG